MANTLKSAGRGAGFVVCVLCTLALSACTGCSHNESSAPAAGSASGEVAEPTPAVPLDLLDLAGATAGALPALPRGWELFQFEKIPATTAYDVVFDGKQPVLRASSSTSASAVRKVVSIDPKRLPVLQWEWKVDHAIEKADCGTKEGDDCAARLLLVYAYDPSSESFLDRTRFAAAKAVNGEYPPSAMIVYAWTDSGPYGEFIDSPYTERTKVFPLEKGSSRAGAWVTEQRNHLEDFRKAFGREPPEIAWVAFMVDTDNTCSTATAWLRSLRFLPERGLELNAPRG